MVAGDTPPGPLHAAIEETPCNVKVPYYAMYKSDKSIEQYGSFLYTLLLSSTSSEYQRLANGLFFFVSVLPFHMYIRMYLLESTVVRCPNKLILVYLSVYLVCRVCDVSGILLKSLYLHLCVLCICLYLYLSISLCV